jgi:serine/threonine protein kinase
LGDIISEGTFGYVCCASNIKSDEKIAIKFYKKQENIEIIEQEIKIGFDKRLICPYIMIFKNDFTFSNQETGGEFRCVSMELMNCSLEFFLKTLNNKNLAIEVLSNYFIYLFILFQTILYIFTQILLGVGVFHINGVVHFDLKLGNILINPDLSIKICIFIFIIFILLYLF